jgi:glucose-6-phosphate 1-dehydrogenase
VINRVVLFGATGDLAGRFLLPALVRSIAAGALPDDLHVVGAGEQDWDDDTFRRPVGARLTEHASVVPPAVRAAFLGRIRYRRVELDDPDSVRRAVRAVGGAAGSPVAVYLALPPGLFAPTLRSLAAVELPPGSRIAVEKPFGQDLAGAIALNAQLAQVSGEAGETAVFRVDHVLGMPRIRDLLERRGPGGDLEPVWNGTSIERIDLLWEETIGLEGRADFYDRTGAVRDVMQNHLVQVLALVAMEPPAGPGEHDLHAAKLAALRSVRGPLAEEVPAGTRRARYEAGRLAGDGTGTGPAVPGYAQEQGVVPDRGTETYAELVFTLDGPRWAGTRVVLRAGKALARDRKGVLLHLREPAPGSGTGDGGPVDQVWIGLDEPSPVTEPGPPVSGELSAYGHVLIDLLGGGSRLSVSADEAEQTWRIVEPVLEAWATGTTALAGYPAGSGGPEPIFP